MPQATKLYAGVPAIEGVDFDLRRGEIHALVGENGAGKSTLDQGDGRRGGADLGQHDDRRRRRLRRRRRWRRGSSASRMVFQENSLVPTMTVAQNLFLGQEKFYNRLRGIYIAAQQFLQSLNFDVTPTATVGGLGAAKKQMVEIARAVLHKAKVIIFDEPTATLTPEEKKYFFDLVRDLKKRGVSIIFISHALEEALLLADRITVLRDGKHVVTDDAAKFDRARIVQAMVGRDLSNTLYGARKTSVRPSGRRVLTVQNLKMAPMVRNNSLSVFAGQITGVFGLVGAGRTETFKIVVRRDETRLLPRRRDPAQRQAGALSRAGAGGQGGHRLCDRGPQGRRLLRDRIDRPQHLSRPARQVPGGTGCCCRDARPRRSARPGSSGSRFAPSATRPRWSSSPAATSRRS